MSQEVVSTSTRRIRALRCSLALGLWLGLASAPTNLLASTEFTASTTLGGLQALNDASEDRASHVATDGDGHWVAVWVTEDPALGAAGNRATVCVRSEDDGQTWTTPALVGSGPDLDEGQETAIATNGRGRWIALLTRYDGNNVAVALSDDDAATWQVPAVIHATALGVYSARIVTDGAGTWVITWTATLDPQFPGGDEQDIYYTRSTDDGVTWSAVEPLNNEAAVDNAPDSNAHLATDGLGNWVAVWSYGASRSVDNGESWSPYEFIPPSLLVDSVYADVAVDADGNWLLVWSARDYYLYDYFLYWQKSTNAGATWSEPELLHPSYFALPGSGQHSQPNLVVHPDGTFQAVWQSWEPLGGALGSGGHDLLTSYSRDGAESWSTPAALDLRAKRNGHSLLTFRSPPVSSPAGTTVVVWVSSDVDGNPNGDGDVRFSRAHRDCPTEARSDCLTSADPRGSRLKIKDSLVAADRLTWRLSGLETTTNADIGDPILTDSYALCLYEKVKGVPALIGEWDAKAGGTCSGHPCWRDDGRAKTLSDSSATRGAIRKLSISGAGSGPGQIDVKASGATLSPPRLPLNVAAPVRIQLVNLGTNRCWEGVHDQASRNEEGQFSSVSD